ncbi:uncharacterized protein LOC114663542 isoform X3 [Erpetoichthys calabaricus]|uniref:uncharacterized protein LOC114663542 isoform X3 n=1 Tax=Erpetoichthys calabaricus TaxID=27687 RepID=UPI002234D2A9|nr:uncharacterized protein LOC114663542 isoform X3 [Erpetoichthys calabaricus]
MADVSEQENTTNESALEEDSEQQKKLKVEEVAAIENLDLLGEKSTYKDAGDAYTKDVEESDFASNLESVSPTVPAKENRPRCEHCNISCSNETQYICHMMGQKHRKKMRELGLLASNEEEMTNRKALEEYVLNPERTEPIIGLQYLTEYRSPGNQHSSYLCTLCDVRSCLDIIFHVTGAKHRHNYLKKMHPDLIPLEEQEAGLVKMHSLLKEKAEMIECKEGCGEVKVQIFEKPKELLRKPGNTSEVKKEEPQEKTKCKDTSAEKREVKKEEPQEKNKCKDTSAEKRVVAMPSIGSVGQLVKQMQTSPRFLNPTTVNPKSMHSLMDLKIEKPSSLGKRRGAPNDFSYSEDSLRPLPEESLSDFFPGNYAENVSLYPGGRFSESTPEDFERLRLSDKTRFSESSPWGQFREGISDRTYQENYQSDLTGSRLHQRQPHLHENIAQRRYNDEDPYIRERWLYEENPTERLYDDPAALQRRRIHEESPDRWAFSTEGTYTDYTSRWKSSQYESSNQRYDLNVPSRKRPLLDHTSPVMNPSISTKSPDTSVVLAVAQKLAQKLLEYEVKSKQEAFMEENSNQMVLRDHVSPEPFPSRPYVRVRLDYDKPETGHGDYLMKDVQFSQRPSSLSSSSYTRSSLFSGSWRDENPSALPRENFSRFSSEWNSLATRPLESSASSREMEVFHKSWSQGYK